MNFNKVDSMVRKLPSCFAVIFIAICFLAACGEAKIAGAESPSSTSTFDEESLYQLDRQWRTQDGDTFRLGQLTGKLPVVTMMFTHCPFACPRIVDLMKKIEEQLPADKTDDVIFVLVSFDLERDQPERLKAFAGEMNLGDNWVLLHGDEAAVRELSMLLGINYKKQPGGDFAHSNVITLLDTRGRITESIEGLGGNPESILKKIEKL